MMQKQIYFDCEKMRWQITLGKPQLYTIYWQKNMWQYKIRYIYVVVDTYTDRGCNNDIMKQ